MNDQYLGPGKILSAFGRLYPHASQQVGMFNRSPNFVSVCGACRRSFTIETVKDVGGWNVANRDADVWLSFEMVWNKRVKREGKGWCSGRGKP